MTIKGDAKEIEGDFDDWEWPDSEVADIDLSGYIARIRDKASRAAAAVVIKELEEDSALVDVYLNKDGTVARVVVNFGPFRLEATSFKEDGEEPEDNGGKFYTALTDTTTYDKGLWA